MDTLGIDPCTFRRARHDTLVHRHERWGTVRADLIGRTGLGRQETRISYPAHMFLMNLKGTAYRGEDFIDGRRIRFSPRRAGSIVYLPAGCAWTGWDEGDATASYLLVSIDRGFADRIFGGIARFRPSCLAPSVGLQDSDMEMALRRIMSELRHPDPISAMMVESQAVQLLVHMLRINGISAGKAKGGLSSFDLKRAIAMIEAMADKRPTLTDLAKEAGVSRYHFLRAFKTSTGMTPHAFIAKHRLEKSAGLLRSTNLTATEIAMECGFASSSHFTVAFKQAYGICPKDFRRQSRI